MVSINFEITDAAKHYITEEKAEKIYITLNISYEYSFRHMKDKIIKIPEKIKIDSGALHEGLTGWVDYDNGYPSITIIPRKNKRKWYRTLVHEFKHIIYSNMTMHQRSKTFSRL